MDQLIELVPFLQEQKSEIKILALQHLSGVSGDQAARDVLKQTNIIALLLRLVGDENNVINRHALTILINLCQDAEMLSDIVKRNIVPRLVDGTTDMKNKLAEIYSMLLSNITHTKEGCTQLLQYGRELEGFYILKLAQQLTNDSSVPSSSALANGGNWVINILLNITQIEEGRNILLNAEHGILVSLLPLLTSKSVLKRRGAMGIIRNCCYSTVHHQYLLSPEIDILTKMLLMIRGPNTLEDDEMEGMNELLKNKPEQASIDREEDKKVRQMIIEALIFLTSLKSTRKTLRDRKVYPIVRNYHLVEKDEKIGEDIEKVVEMLIRDEDESAADTHKNFKIDDPNEDDDASNIEEI
ncbi:armadillo-like helical domain-containing protein [Cavenderia fasciculata]|uniref:Protein HGH1 homolog n=1 Tax=Cavenderia fasciculata TaxID=261658 RepID=F4PRR9_CACFS|nr:armadillo-like helical domain-containing protein [Cavenderia fasciculata]EGG20568.1 armadillo-like helical domain-containing protein [Cavenderia fasciculata]|eukprot:XP_004358418.1 armadillo-like helical domain-containing protein [Cavenderia fasciculata]